MNLQNFCLEVYKQIQQHSLMYTRVCLTLSDALLFGQVPASEHTLDPCALAHPIQNETHAITCIASQNPSSSKRTCPQSHARERTRTHT
jgi:hypothetical protein